MRTHTLGTLLFVFICFGTAGGQSVNIETAPLSIAEGETIILHSAVMKEDRRVDIYFPPSYPYSRRRYPVIYTFDGRGTGPLTAGAVRFMTRYSSLPQMPEAIVAAIVNTDRNRDMPVPEGYGKGGEAQFLSFVEHEVIPAVEQRYRTEPLRILLGHSQGGLFSCYAFASRPELFRWCVVIDAPLSGFSETKPIMEKMRSVISRNDGRSYRVVSVEYLYGWKKEWPVLLASAARSFVGDRIEIADETHETMVYRGIYEGLKRLFRDYSPVLSTTTKEVLTVPALEELYGRRSLQYGYQVQIPEELLLASASQQIGMQSGEEAVELIKRAESLYGRSQESERLLNEAEEAEKKGRDPRLQEWSNLPPPNAEAMKPFLGVWRLTSDRGAETMTFDVVNGAVRSTCTVSPEGGEPFGMELQFVRVLNGQTLQWGLRNGRGAGIILRTLRLVDRNTLKGTTEPVGIRFAPPPHEVIFRRAGTPKG